MRQEIINRQTLSYTLVAAELAVFGGGTAAARALPAVMIALGVVSTLLWLFWLALTIQVYRISAYIALRLRPRLIEIYRSPLLEWEGYVRELTDSGSSAARVLYGNEHGPQRFFRNKGGVYTSLLFGGGTPLFLTTAFAVTGFDLDGAVTLWAAAVASLALWFYAFWSAVSVMRTAREISRLIVAGYGR